MSHERGEDPALELTELNFLLALAGQLDAQVRILPDTLDKNRSIYHAYAVLDGTSSSCSMFKYLFELYFATNDNDSMHEFISSPEGMAAITCDMIFLATFSFLASLFEKDEAGTTKKNVEVAWRYFRDLLKGLKNAYKGGKSSILIISLLGNIELKYLITPLGLALGVIAVVSRWWISSIRDKRKTMIKANNRRLLEILKFADLTKVVSDLFLSQIEFQDDEERIHAFFIVGLCGFIDGLNLFIGVLGLALLSSPALLAMTLICSMYVLINMTSRIYEEYEDQLDLIVTQEKCKLALITREMQVSYTRLLSLHYKINKSLEDLAQTEYLKTGLKLLIMQFKEQHQLVQTQITRTYFTAVLSGMKYGLFAYGVLTSFLFITPTLFIMPPAVFPPTLLIISIVMGCILMIGFVAFTVNAHSHHLNKQKSKELDSDTQLREMQRIVEECEGEDIFYKSLNKSLCLDPSPKFFIQEGLEVFRSLFSGLSKGDNVARFFGILFQERDSQGHYHDNPLIAVFEIGGALLFGIILALRALARGFSEKPPVQIDLVEHTRPINAETPPRETKQTEALGESCDTIQSPANSPPPPPISIHGFFSTPPKKLPQLNSNVFSPEFGR